VLRKTTRFEIKDEALHKIAELMAYAMGINLFLAIRDLAAVHRARGRARMQ
jgi:hypothetical protein